MAAVCSGTSPALWREGSATPPRFSFGGPGSSAAGLIGGAASVAVGRLSFGAPLSSASLAAARAVWSPARFKRGGPSSLLLLAGGAALPVPCSDPGFGSSFQVSTTPSSFFDDVAPPPDFSQYTLTAVMLLPVGSSCASTDTWSPTLNLGVFISSPDLKNLVLSVRLKSITRLSPSSTLIAFSSKTFRLPRKFGSGPFWFGAGVLLLPVRPGTGMPEPVGLRPPG